MSQHSNTSTEQISEEANGGAFLFLNNYDPILGLDFDFLSDESPLSGISISGVCDFPNFTDSGPDCVEPNELDGYLGPLLSDALFEPDNKRALINALPMQVIKKEKRSPRSTKPIPLSQSVGVGAPQHNMTAAQKIQIVYPLEEFFRPRYKSDYFAQNGKSRKPRYVADRTGNHFVTLKVPVGVRGRIRVDWLTIPDKCGDRYSMPYRFQQSNEDAEVPDCNPLYVDVNALNTDKNGTMKLYLVLIKSKQDALKSLQPLKPFQPFKDLLGVPSKFEPEALYPMNAKLLIQKYHLDQSQLAFTFCALTTDGRFNIEWDTTVFSTIMTEIPPENTKQKDIQCPHCQCVFPISINSGNGEQEIATETITHKRKVNTFGTEQIIIKKRTSFHNNS